MKKIISALLLASLFFNALPTSLGASSHAPTANFLSAELNYQTLASVALSGRRTLFSNEKKPYRTPYLFILLKGYQRDAKMSVATRILRYRIPLFNLMAKASGLKHIGPFFEVAPRIVSRLMVATRSKNYALIDYTLTSQNDYAFFRVTMGENQRGVMLQMVQMIEELGWTIEKDNPHFRHIIERKDGNSVLHFKLRMPTNQKPLEAVARLRLALAGFERLRGEKPPLEGKPRILHLGFSPGPVALGRLLQTLYDLDINIETITAEEARPGGKSLWTLEVTVPRGSGSRLEAVIEDLRHETGEHLLPIREMVFNINETTAWHAKTKMDEWMDRHPIRKSKFKYWLDNTNVVLDFPHEGNPDPLFLDQLEAALDIATEFHANQKRSSDDSPYIVHPIEVAYTLIAYGVRDPVVILAAILHDIIEDGPFQYLLAHPDAMPGVPFVNEEARVYMEAKIEDRIRTAFPSFGNKLISTIRVMSQEEKESDAEYLAKLAERGLIDLLALKLADRTLNLLDRRSAELQLKTIRVTILYFLGLVSIRPDTINQVYKRSRQHFLLVLLRELGTLADIRWSQLIKSADWTVAAPHISRLFIWMRTNRDSLPRLARTEDRNLMHKFKARLELLRTRKPSTTLHFPIELWREVRAALAKGFEDGKLSDSVYDRVVSQGLGVARIENGAVVIEEEALPFILNPVNEYRARQGIPPLTLLELRNELEKHETWHLYFRRSPFLRPRTLMLLADAKFHETSQVEHFADFKARFVATYGAEFEDEARLAEEAWVLAQSGTGLLGHGIQLQGMTLDAKSAASLRRVQSAPSNEDIPRALQTGA